MKTPRRLIVAITGATGTIFGVRLLQLLQGTDVETHLVVSRWGARTLLHETSFTLEQVRRLATHAYAEGDQGAALSSGSFVTMGMVVLPCSMKTLAAIAHGNGEDLVHRAADVVLKERRRLVLAVREAPLNTIHLENMLKLSRMGVVISPPVPAFYNRPRTLDDVVDHTVVRILDLFDIHLDVAERWSGTMMAGGTALRPPQPTPLAAAARKRRRAGR
jgi:4-hydroxy-3-polyprenylbenzoate decarboxylase